MLANLEITNFGLVEHLELHFGPGLNVLSGETGAGKSIIIEALKTVLGDRANAEYIKSGREKALIQAFFELDNLPELKSQLAATGLECEGDVLVLTRQLSRSGRNLCRINGQVTTLQQLREFSNYLVDIHGQHEQQSLLNQNNHVELLDRFSGEKLIQKKQKTRDLYDRWKAVTGYLEEIIKHRREVAREADMLRYQIKEIDNAALTEGEEDDLLAERKRVANRETLVQLAQSAYEALYSGTGTSFAAVDCLGRATDALAKLAEIDSSLQPTREAVSSALYQIEEASRELLSYRDGIEFQPGRLEEIENRLSEIGRLKTKYGNTVSEIIAYRREAALRLDESESREARESHLAKENKELEESYRRVARELSSLRSKGAIKLKGAMEKELQTLEMANVTLEVKISPADPGPNGIEDIAFLISTNKGEPPKPLTKVASGGELSRIMLAFKTVLTAADRIPCLVFDEVDTGIGGKTIQSVARKLENLSRHRQIIVVTHSAAIAALADAHYAVDKQSQGGKTFTRVSLLKDDQKVEELTRMLGGKTSRPALDHARQLLQQKKS